MAPVDPRPVGAVLAGRYQILERLGVGAMGAVFRAHDRELDEVVALKLLRPDLSSQPDFLSRFRREVKLARLVTHRNVARTFDIGEHEGERFLTMELLDGQSLGARLGRGRLDIADAVAIFCEVCAGLAAAHDAGVVHRDLKPDNIMLCGDGRVVLTDFGVARGVAQAGTQTGASIVGTPAYMAPEQIDQSAPIDARADVYALGCMLFEALTGQLPWRGSLVHELLFPRLFKDPPDPRGLRPELPDTIAQAILRCMARDPAQRFASARDVAAALQRATVELPADALVPVSCPPPAPAPTPVAAPAPMATKTQAAGPRTVAVLPLRNGGPPEDAYLADGLTEDLIDTLSMTPGLRVRPRGAVQAHRDPDADPRVVGKALDVEVLITGTLRRQGNDVRVSVRAVHVAAGFQLYTQVLTRPAAAVFSMSEELARALGEALTMRSPDFSRALPADPAVVDLYLRARHAYHQADRPHRYRAAELFGQALELSPDDPLLLSGYALARARLWYFGGEGAEAEARAAAQRALELAPQRGESHLAQAVLHYQAGDLPTAVRAIREALRLAPALAEAHEYLGRVLVETGPVARGMGALRDALALDPALQGARMGLARAHALLGEWALVDEYMVFGDELLDLSGLWLMRGRLAAWRGDRERARALLAHPEVSAGRFPIAQVLLALTAGERRSVKELATFAMPLQAGSPRGVAFLLQVQLEVFALAGETAAALAELRRIPETVLVDLDWLERCPVLAPLRGHVEYGRVRSIVAARAAAVQAALAD